ncbi:MAG: IS110 family transposase, partial [Pseudomonadota bacterium]
MKQLVYGVDLAKSVFQIHSMDTRGKALVRKQIYRADMKRYFANIPKAIVAMEACSGAHYWGRVFRNIGHEVRLISPQFVKPYVKSNKNDMADAEAIAEAATRPGMRFVAVKEVKQQDIMLIHRVRERLVRNRTALMNEIRGFLHEYGIVFPKGERYLKSGLLKLFGDDCSELSDDTRNEIMELYEELVWLDERIDKMDLKIKRLYQGSEVCR